MTEVRSSEHGNRQTTCYGMMCRRNDIKMVYIKRLEFSNRQLGILLSYPYPGLAYHNLTHTQVSHTIISPIPRSSIPLSHDWPLDEIMVSSWCCGEATAVYKTIHSINHFFPNAEMKLFPWDTTSRIRKIWAVD